jgi:hypothetical protein
MIVLWRTRRRMERPPTDGSGQEKRVIQDVWVIQLSVSPVYRVSQ